MYLRQEGVIYVSSCMLGKRIHEGSCPRSLNPELQTKALLHSLVLLCKDGFGNGLSHPGVLSRRFGIQFLRSSEFWDPHLLKRCPGRGSCGVKARSVVDKSNRVCLQVRFEPVSAL